jgi:hypothetical protein
MSEKIHLAAASAGKNHVVKTALQELAKCTDLQNNWMTDGRFVLRL